MNFQAPSRRQKHMSPLWTSLPQQILKREFIKTHGKDADGAFRVRRRIDQAA